MRPARGCNSHGAPARRPLVSAASAADRKQNERHRYLCLLRAGTPSAAAPAGRERWQARARSGARLVATSAAAAATFLRAEQRLFKCQLDANLHLQQTRAARPLDDWRLRGAANKTSVSPVRRRRFERRTCLTGPPNRQGAATAAAESRETSAGAENNNSRRLFDFDVSVEILQLF